MIYRVCSAQFDVVLFLVLGSSVGGHGKGWLPEHSKHRHLIRCNRADEGEAHGYRTAYMYFC